MHEASIVNCSGSPKIEGTRITVYTVFEDLQNGYSREKIAALYGISLPQVQAAIDYIHANEDLVRTEYETIMERIRKGNPPHIEAILAENHKKLLARMAELQAAKLESAPQ